MLRRINPQARQAGAATVEFYLVALLALMPMCLGMLQISLLLVDNHHVDHAAFMATRAGSTHNGDVGAMRSEFARVLTPLFVGIVPADAANVVARVAEARLRAAADVAAFSGIRVLAPDASAQRDFAELRDGETAIPSDSLQHRSTRRGPSSGLTVQQANMLRVEFTYCRPMIVPFVRGMMLGLLQRLDTVPGHQRCYAAGRVPILSVGVAPMQTDFRAASSR